MSRRTDKHLTQFAKTHRAITSWGTAHTLANFESAFYRSTTSDNSSYEQWLEDGGDDAAKRANKIWKERLASYVAPPLDEAIDEELKEFVAKRKSELPDTFG